MKKILIVLILIIGGISPMAFSQTSAPDSVVIKIGESSKVIFAIHKDDLQTLKYYDFQALMNDMITKLENEDRSNVATPPSDYLIDNQNETVADGEEEITYEWPEDEDSNRRYGNDDDSGWVTYEGNDRTYRNSERHENRSYRGRRTTSSINFDVGTNNFLSDGKFPDSNNDLYTVKPFGSWYVGINSIQRTRLARKFFLEWGVGVSWYNFKFENQRTIMTKDDAGVTFVTDTRDLDFKKSKLTASYINASFVPVIDFGGNRRKPMLFDSRGANSFRIGVGPYAGYRIDSYTKQVYEENGDKKRDRNHDNYFLENIRYGARLQIGFDDVDLFFNYDMNELFSDGKGPALNAFSFGITF
ncbi:MAG: hypothetical protein KDC93_11385 [Cyclobacteriaceae bacterium]|jgi:hypothetical protein|nr:hypothetical protein [Cyclobacteriaceae bacterium]